jgi:hypothetical protein
LLVYRGIPAYGATVSEEVQLEFAAKLLITNTDIICEQSQRLHHLLNLFSVPHFSSRNIQNKKKERKVKKRRKVEGREAWEGRENAEVKNGSPRLGRRAERVQAEPLVATNVNIKSRPVI